MNFKKKFLVILIVILCSALTPPTSKTNAQQAASWVTSVSWSPDSKQVAVSNSVGVSIYGGANRLGALRSFGQPHIAYAVSWSPDGSKLVTAHADSLVRVWDARNSKLLASLSGHTKGVNSISWDPDGSKFASVGDDGKLIIWDGKSYKPLKVIQYSAPLNLVAWSPDGSKIATNVVGVNIQIWDAQGNHIRDLDESAQRSLTWGPDSKTILSDNPGVVNINDDTINTLAN